MANTIGQGQITIMDYNDGLTLTSLIDINKPLVFQADTNTGALNPEISATSTMLLTPRVFVSGMTDDKVTTVKLASGDSAYWTYKTSASDSWNVIDSNYETINATTKVLTIKQNRLAASNINQVTYRFRCAWYSEVNNFDIITENYVTISKVLNGNGAIIANVYCPEGNTFKNKTPLTINVKAELIRGASVDASVTAYQWQRFTSSEWVDITNTTNMFEGAKSQILIVYAEAVSSYMMVRCKITDLADGVSTTYISAGQSIIDTQDAYKVELIGTSQYLKNGIGSITITANVYQANTLISDTSGFTFAWAKIDKDGTSTPLSETSNTLAIDGNDVDVKATFICTVSQ